VLDTSILISTNIDWGEYKIMKAKGECRVQRGSSLLGSNRLLIRVVLLAWVYTVY
jgi:hypothetical protein